MKKKPDSGNGASEKNLRTNLQTIRENWQFDPENIKKWDEPTSRKMLSLIESHIRWLQANLIQLKEKGLEFHVSFASTKSELNKLKMLKRKIENRIFSFQFKLFS